MERLDEVLFLEWRFVLLCLFSIERMGADRRVPFREEQHDDQLIYEVLRCFLALTLSLVRLHYLSCCFLRSATNLLKTSTAWNRPPPTNLSSPLHPINLSPLLPKTSWRHNLSSSNCRSYSITVYPSPFRRKNRCSKRRRMEKLLVWW